MATFSKLPLSGSIDGRPIRITANASASANAIHTTQAGTSSMDEVYLYAYNDTTASIQVSVLWGATVEPDCVFRTTLLSQYGRTLIADGMILRNGLTVYAYTNISGSIVNVDGFVNRIS